jgi:NAD(P)-dependent dehydrogenase (short-subunit alcohol dehydrogenase family)
MVYSLKSRRVLITGGSKGLGAEIARKFAAEGSNLAINYNSDTSTAEALASELSTTYNITAIALRGDAASTDEMTSLIHTTVAKLGGLDIIIGNAGWTRFTEKPFSDLSALSYEDWDRCFAVNVKGNHALLAAAMPIFTSNPDGGVFLMTSSIAGRAVQGSSMAYSVTKAAQLHLMKCLAQTQGAEGKVRINAVCPGLLLTEWGQKFGEERIEMIKKAAVLRRETDLGDCADAFVMLARNGSITGQAVSVGELHFFCGLAECLLWFGEWIFSMADLMILIDRFRPRDSASVSDSASQREEDNDSRTKCKIMNNLPPQTWLLPSPMKCISSMKVDLSGLSSAPRGEMILPS